MERCDVLVVGGGPGGSACATRLRAAGLDVLVLDRATFPRDKPCAGWVTPPVFEALDLSPAEYAASGRTLQPIAAFRTGLAGGALRETSFAKPVSYGILRREFDDHLLKRSGARLLTGTAAKSFVRVDDRWIVNGEIEAPLLIGAGGHFCPVARFLGAHLGAEHAVLAQEIEFPVADAPIASGGALPGVPELSFSRDLRGYGWVFRKGNHLNVGFGREADRDITHETRAFFEEAKRVGKLPPDFPEAWKGHAYLLYGSSRRPLGGDGVLLVGDAAGLAYRESGEGIRTAVESGLLAASVALEAKSDLARVSLPRYRQLVEERFGSRREGEDFATPGPLSRALAPLAMALPWFRRRVLVEREFLRAHVPALTS